MTPKMTTVSFPTGRYTLIPTAHMEEIKDAFDNSIPVRGDSADHPNDRDCPDYSLLASGQVFEAAYNAMIAAIADDLPGVVRHSGEPIGCMIRANGEKIGDFVSVKRMGNWSDDCYTKALVFDHPPAQPKRTCDLTDVELRDPEYMRAYVEGCNESASEFAKPIAELEAKLAAKLAAEPTQEPVKWPYPITESDIRQLISDHQRDGKRHLGGGMDSSGSYLIRVAESFQWCLNRIAEQSAHEAIVRAPTHSATECSSCKEYAGEVHQLKNEIGRLSVGWQQATYLAQSKQEEISEALKIMRCDPEKISLTAAANMMIARHDQADLEKERKEFVYFRQPNFEHNWQTKLYWITVWDNSVGERINFYGTDHDECIDKAISHFKNLARAEEES